MKPPPFEYEAPTSADEAVRLLAEGGTALAGGQSLVPLLNLRLAFPQLVVDLNGVGELDYIDVEGDGALRIGAMTRQAALEHSEAVARGWPLLAKAVRLVGHPQIRTRGTIGGSVAHADPAAELPAALIVLGARFHLSSATATRSVEASDFFLGPLDTVREPEELLVEIEVPAQPDGSGAGFAEHARTHGDFATAGAAAVVAPGGYARLALLGAGPAPARAEAAERALASGADAREAAELAAQPVDGEHRRALCAELARRAIEEAMA